MSRSKAAQRLSTASGDVRSRFASLTSRASPLGPAGPVPLLLLGCALLMAACAAPFQASTPKGFASLDSEAPFQAVTPEGVMYRVRHGDNEPRADLAFWRKALKQRMAEAGYVFVADTDIKAGAVPGYLLELAAPFGPRDYGYLVAVFVRGDDLTLVESAGPLAELRKRRPAVVDAIKRIRW